MPFQYITTSIHVVDVQNLVEIDSAIARACKTRLGVNFLFKLTGYLSCSSSGLRHSVMAILMLNGSNNVLSLDISAFWGLWQKLLLKKEI